MLACRTRRLALLRSVLPSLSPAHSASFSSTPKCTVQRAQRAGKRLSSPRLDTADAISLFQTVKASVSTQKSAANLMTQKETLSFNDNLVKLRLAIQNANANDLVRVWDGLNIGFERQSEFVGENRMGFTGLKQILTSTHLQPLSEAVHTRFAFLWPTQHKFQLNDDVQRVLGEICVASAVIASSYDGLISYMGFLFRKGKLDEVIALSSRLASCDIKPTQSAAAVEEEQGRESELAFYDTDGNSNLPRSVRYHPNRATILLWSLAAYASREDFRGALHTALGTDVRLQGAATKRFIDANLSQRPDLVSRLNDYINRIGIARTAIHSKILTSRITKLADEGRSNVIERICNDIATGISGPNPYIAADPSLNEGNRPVVITESGWATFLAGFLRCRRPDLAEKLWNNLLSFGIQPGVMLWTALISGHGSAGNVKDALKVWETMNASGIQPDGVTYRALISILFSVQSDTVAMQKFSEFQKQLAKKLPESQVLPVYNTVLHSLLTSNNEEEAKRILEDMKKSGPKPDLVTYNTFMRYYGRRSMFQEMADLFKELESRKIVGDVFTFSTILSAFLKAGRPNAAEMVITFMRKHGVEPNVATQSAIIDQQMRQQDETGIRGAMDILSAMERDPNMKPNEVTYTSILAGIHRTSWMSPEEKERIRKDITHRMDRAKISPGRLTYQILMQACFDNPGPEGMQEAMDYYRTMIDRGILFTHETWYVVLRGLLQREAWEEADEAVRRMYGSIREPKTRLLEVVKQIKMRTSKGRNTPLNRYL